MQAHLETRTFDRHILPTSPQFQFSEGQEDNIFFQLCFNVLRMYYSLPPPEKNILAKVTTIINIAAHSGKFSGPACTEKLKRKTKLNFVEMFHLKLETFSTDYFYIHFS